MFFLPGRVALQIGLSNDPQRVASFYQLAELSMNNNRFRDAGMRTKSHVLELAFSFTGSTPDARLP